MDSVSRDGMRQVFLMQSAGKLVVSQMAEAHDDERRLWEDNDTFCPLISAWLLVAVEEVVVANGRTPCASVLSLASPLGIHGRHDELSGSQVMPKVFEARAANISLVAQDETLLLLLS